ncbi:MAG: hypothetical protein ABSH34_16180, partial [Verrucomicrobiota bacterium]
MHPAICICCGERISETGRDFSRNPNLCPSCSSLWDGMEDDNSRLPHGQEPERARQPEAARQRQ